MQAGLLVLGLVGSAVGMQRYISHSISELRKEVKEDLESIRDDVNSVEQDIKEMREDLATKEDINRVTTRLDRNAENIAAGASHYAVLEERIVGIGRQLDYLVRAATGDRRGPTPAPSAPAD